jgi:hypothetical protein
MAQGRGLGTDQLEEAIDRVLKKVVQAPPPKEKPKATAK